MSDNLTASRVVRVVVYLRSWGFTWGTLLFLAGAASGSFYKFTFYYLAEQAQVEKLGGATDNIKLLQTRIDALEKSDAAQNYTNQINISAHNEFAQHLHALDAREDANRDAMADLGARVGTEGGKIGWLLDTYSRGGLALPSAGRPRR